MILKNKKYFEEILKIYIKDNCLTFSDSLQQVFALNNNDAEKYVEKDAKNDKNNKHNKQFVDTNRHKHGNEYNQNNQNVSLMMEKLKHCKSIQDIKNILDTKEILHPKFFLNRFATNIVIGDGIENAKILVIGEAPGETEDEQGIPFCGKSGQLLEKAFSTIGLHRTKNIYITNTVFWRPENNRKPTNEELNFCFPFLRKIIQIINPVVIITTGSVATNLILQNEQPISSLIGKFVDVDFQEVNEQINKQVSKTSKIFRCFPIYHPSYLLRSPGSKKILWKNLLTLDFLLEKDKIK